MEGPPCSKTIKTLTHVFSTTSVVLFLYQTAPFLKIILEQSKRPRLEVGHQGAVFQHPGANAGVPLQQLMPTAQGKAQRSTGPSSSERACAGRGLAARPLASTGTVAAGGQSGFWGWGLALSSGAGRERACAGAGPLLVLGLPSFARLRARGCCHARGAGCRACCA